MGVRGKVEAVIYAAEEPVTLAQLVALFGTEALEERAVRLAQQPSDAEGAEAEPDASLESIPSVVEGDEPAEGDADAGPEVADSIDAESSDADGPAAQLPEPALEQDSTETEATSEPAEEESVPEAETDAEESAAESLEAATPETPQDEEEAARRAARQRDREAREELRFILGSLIADYAAGERGMEIREIAGGYRVATKPEYHDAVRAFVRSLKPPMKLSLQALETLAVVAYKQPITSPEISEIRGVDSGGVLGSLISRKLVTTAGRKQVVGRPMLYKTTKEFLLRFGLKDLNELPSMEEFEKMASELEAGQDETPNESAAELLPNVRTPDEAEPDAPVIEVAEAEPSSEGVSVDEDGDYSGDESSVEEEVEEAAEAEEQADMASDAPAPGSLAIEVDEAPEHEPEGVAVTQAGNDTRGWIDDDEEGDDFVEVEDLDEPFDDDSEDTDEIDADDETPDEDDSASEDTTEHPEPVNEHPEAQKAGE